MHERELNPPSFYLDTEDEFCKNKGCGAPLSHRDKGGVCGACVEEENADKNDKTTVS